MSVYRFLAKTTTMGYIENSTSAHPDRFKRINIHQLPENEEIKTKSLWVSYRWQARSDPHYDSKIMDWIHPDNQRGKCFLCNSSLPRFDLPLKNRCSSSILTMSPSRKFVTIRFQNYSDRSKATVRVMGATGSGKTTVSAVWRHQSGAFVFFLLILVLTTK